MSNGRASLFSIPLTVAGFVLLMLSVFGFLGERWWIFDIMNSFRPQYAVIGLVLCLCFSYAKRQWMLSLSLLCLIINAALVAPFFVAPGQKAAAHLQRTTKVVLLNVLTANTRYQEVESYLLSENSDIIVLNEVSASWLAHLEGLRKHFIHFSEIPRDDNFGIALYSKFPLESVEDLMLGGINTPTLHAKVEIDGKPVSILATHALPPRNASLAERWYVQLQALGVYAASINEPLILVGDLNASHWSLPFKAMMKTAKLQNTSHGLGLHRSWPISWFSSSWQDRFLLWAMRIPIDHVLVSRDFIVVNKSVGPALGSDHLPVIVELASSPGSASELGGG